ncbi:hypothetical protein CCAX7_59390 [Capsulimonas corticalis]|uniref:histidine kinase n=1 Tax=Capsulimonas corticalis TaxID=2219043 RepID=A0A402CZP4_9BACT|nr:hypothetical protein CCAX7_59390 [Capsulimonas corticalis]
MRAAASVTRSYLWPVLSVAAATGCFSLLRPYVDKGQASLLYLPIVLACAVRFGFGPAILGALLSFLCWDLFFLPPFYTLAVDDPKDWLSLAIFLLAAVVTARLAAQARAQTQEARTRESEIETLFEASETVSRVIRADRVLAALADQLQTLCGATRCLVFRRLGPGVALQLAPDGANEVPIDAQTLGRIASLAEAACANDRVIGLGASQHLWAKAVTDTDASLGGDGARIGVYIPLHAADALVGVLHVGPRGDSRPYSALEERLILTLANHAAVVIARDRLTQQAAEATALREADTLKDALVSLVSHELRTPLAAIKASVSGLLQPGAVWDPDARQEALVAIDGEADRLSGVVNNLLDLSRLEAGAWLPRKDWCDLAEVAGTALDRLPPAEASRVALETQDNLPLVQADYTQIALVLTNLMENAIKYTPSGSPIQVTMRAENDRTNSGQDGVLVTVRDFGHGFALGDEERLFDRFYRGAKHQGGAVHGTGLGLALCQAVIRAHGGRIWAANAPPGEPDGAIFSFFLPKG